MLGRPCYVVMNKKLIFVHIEFRSRWKCRSGRNWKSVPARNLHFQLHARLVGIGKAETRKIVGRTTRDYLNGKSYRCATQISEGTT
jgi:hypothetical protein